MLTCADVQHDTPPYRCAFVVHSSTLETLRIAAQSAGTTAIFNPAPAPEDGQLPAEIYSLTDIFVVNETEVRMLHLHHCWPHGTFVFRAATAAVLLCCYCPLPPRIYPNIHFGRRYTRARARARTSQTPWLRIMGLRALIHTRLYPPPPLL